MQRKKPRKPVREWLVFPNAEQYPVPSPRMVDARRRLMEKTGCPSVAVLDDLFVVVGHGIRPNLDPRHQFPPKRDRARAARRLRTCRQCSRMVRADGKPGPRLAQHYPSSYMVGAVCSDCRTMEFELRKQRLFEAGLIPHDLLAPPVADGETWKAHGLECRRRERRTLRLPRGSFSRTAIHRGLPTQACTNPCPILLPEPGGESEQKFIQEIEECRATLARGEEWHPRHVEDRATRRGLRNEPVKSSTDNHLAFGAEFGGYRVKGPVNVAGPSSVIRRAG